MNEGNSPPPKWHWRAGFSLVETVAAMGILALAAVPLLQLTSDATRNAARLENRLLARTVAENVMARTLAEFDDLEAGLELGTQTQMSRLFSWSRLVGPPDEVGLQAIEVTVTRTDDTQIIARLIGLKAASLALPEGAPGPDEIPNDFLPENTQ